MIKFRINPISRQIQPLDLADPTPEEVASQEFKEISLEIDEICMGNYIAFISKKKLKCFFS